LSSYVRKRGRAYLATEMPNADFSISKRARILLPAFLFVFSSERKKWELDTEVLQY
jgi:hypothetical protein